MFTDFTIANLREHYDKMYDKPRTDQQAIELLIQVYGKEMGDNNISHSTKEGIGEIYRELMGKGLPSYYWMLEAIHRTAKKRSDKRHFRYIVGTLRNWALYGFGNTLTDEEEEIYEYFTEISGLSVNQDSRKIINTLMGRFGAVKLLRNMPNMLDGVDLASIVAENLARQMLTKYGVTQDMLIEQPRGTKGNVIAIANSQTKPIAGKATSEKTRLMIMYVEEYLQGKEFVRPTDIASYLSNKGFDTITPKNITSHLKTVMNNTEHIQKIGTGKYAYV